MTGVPTLATAQLSSKVRVAVVRLTRRLRAERGETGHTMTQLSALVTIDRHGPISPGDLAAHERVQPPSMTRVLADLGLSGLIARTAHPTDGRQSLITITRKGRELLEADRRRRDVWLSKRFAELSPEELEALARALPVLERLAQA